MQLSTTRFGQVNFEIDDILHFPQGLVGFEDSRHWILLADADNEALGWLQSMHRPDIALPVISPRRFVPGFQVHVSKKQLAPLELTQFDHAFVLSVVSKSGDELTVNLRAPLIVNLDRRLGRQVITIDEQPVALSLVAPAVTFRKIA